MNSIISFLLQAEKLKVELRHSWTSNPDRQESVAEHTWMMSLIAMAIFENISVPFDQLRVLKMVTLHDLAEAITGDIPYFEESERKQNKQENERVAMKTLTKSCSPSLAEEVMTLWEEYEARTSIEAKLAKAIDKYEAFFSHYVSDMSTWDEHDFAICFGKDPDIFSWEPSLQHLKEEIDQLTYTKIEEAGLLESVSPADIDRYIGSVEH